jgi:uncharacterized membrane protein HdeD (DUF308 family)
MKSFTTNRIIFAVGAAVLGIILLIWPATSLIIMAKCIGALVAIGGIAAAYQFYKDHDSPAKSLLLVMAAVMIICGAVIFLHPEELVKLIPMIMGILVLISGLINLGETFTLSKKRYSRWWLSLIIAVITIGAGLFLITRAFSLAALITRIAGGILLFDGLSDLWVISRVHKADKDAQAVDVQAEEVKPEAGASPVQPNATSAQPQATAEQPAVTPEQPVATPEQPAVTPEQPVATPVQPAVTPEQPTAAQEQPTATQVQETVTAEPVEAAPEEPAPAANKPDLTFGEENPQ